MLQPSITKISWKITFLRFLWKFPGANELTTHSEIFTNDNQALFLNVYISQYISLYHWVPVTHICISNLTIIGSDNGFSPGQCQAIIWTNGEKLLIWPLGTNFNEILIEIHWSQIKKIGFEMSPARCRPFCLGLNLLTIHVACALLCLLWFGTGYITYMVQGYFTGTEKIV